MCILSLIFAVISIVFALLSIYYVIKKNSNKTHSVDRIVELELEKQEYERYIMSIFLTLKKRKWHDIPKLKIEKSNKDFLTEEVKKVLDLLANSQ